MKHNTSEQIKYRISVVHTKQRKKRFAGNPGGSTSQKLFA